MEGSELIDEALESIFINQLINLNHSTMIEVERTERLRKVKVLTELQEKADSIYGYLREVDTIPEITDKVYAMGRAVEIKMGLP